MRWRTFNSVIVPKHRRIAYRLTVLLAAWCLLVPRPAGAVHRWSKLIHNQSWVQLRELVQVPGGGYVATGSIADRHDFDLLVIKLDPSGNITWQKRYRGPSTDEGYSIRPTSDGGYVVAGETYSLQGRRFMDEFWVLKLDAAGGVVWQKKLGAQSGANWGYVRQAQDGGYIVAGTLGFAGPSYWDFAPWIVKLDPSGGIVWQRRYDTSPLEDSLDALETTPDNGLIAASGLSLFKFDADGQPQWQKSYRTEGGGYINQVRPVTGGGYILTATQYDAGLQHKVPWVARLGEGGDILWQRTYAFNPPGEELFLWDVRPALEGGFILSGYPAMLMKLDADGTPEWAARYGLERGSLLSVQQTDDGGLVACGWADVGEDYAGWILKFDAAGNLGDCGIRNAQEIAVRDMAVPVVDAAATVTDTSATISGTDAEAGNTAVGSTNQCRDPLEITVESPNGGSNIPAGAERNIAWSAPPGAVEFNVDYSPDRGRSWQIIARRAPGIDSVEWRVPVPADNVRQKCLVRVQGFDASGARVGMDRSDSFFGIKVVKLTPSDMAAHPGGAFPLTWTTYSTIRPVARADLWMSLDGGATWNEIANLPGNPGKSSCKLPETTADHMLVRLRLKDRDGQVVGSDVNKYDVQSR